MLGAGEGGKSTIFFELGRQHGRNVNGKSPEEVAHFWGSFNCMYALADLACESYDQSVTYRSSTIYDVEDGNKETREMLKECVRNKNLEVPPFVPNIGPEFDALVAFWQDPGIQRLYADRHKIPMGHLRDRVDYCLNRMENYAGDSEHQHKLKSGRMTPYEISLSTCRTTGIVENRLPISPDKFPALASYASDAKYSLYDVGGQRNERKKWIHCFEHVAAIVFVISLTEYQYTLFEDFGTNRLAESCKLSDEITNSRWFVGRPIFIVLNKYDQFCELLPTVPFSSKIKDYHGSEDPASVIKWIQDDIKSKAKSQEVSDRLTFLPPMSAHNPDDCRSMIDAVLAKLEDECVNSP